MQNINRTDYWQKIYQQKSSDSVSWYQQQASGSFQLIKKSASCLTDPVIDIGSGASVLVDQLVDAGFSQLSILDISAAALQISKQRLAGASKDIEWLVDDVTQFTPSRQYRVWHDRAVFHFLTIEQDRRAYVAALKQALMPGGYAVIATFSIGGPKQCSGLPTVQYDADKICMALGDGFTLLDQMTENHITPAQSTQIFSYFRFKKNS
jgi:2-polyprenyl-3-methyl-5-hydroxy-6-metoxy-1,4-benzoquinol methylase